MSHLAVYLLLYSRVVVGVCQWSLDAEFVVIGKHWARLNLDLEFVTGRIGARTNIE